MPLLSKILFLFGFAGYVYATYRVFKERFTTDTTQSNIPKGYQNDRDKKIGYISAYLIVFGGIVFIVDAYLRNVG